MEDVVNHGLEGCRAVCEAEEHHEWLEETSICPERGLPLITFLYTDILETPPDI